jgi:uncharacterized protein YndB with AHSA1/START domain
MTTPVLEPVIATVRVGVPPDRAFATFTERVGEWWPVQPVHSIGGDKVADVVLEPGAGGRFFERWHDGTEHTWGGVTVWEPPSRLAVWWRPDPDATYEPTSVEVTFARIDSGTEVRLVHTGWERLGDAGQEARAGYDRGWPIVLTPFVELLTT